MVPPVAADLALDAALLMGALKARRRELRAEQIVRAQRDEPVALDPATPLEDLLDRGGQVVEADLGEHAAEPVERQRVHLKERLLGLDQRRLAERRAGERGPHHEQMHRRRHARELNLGLAPVDLGLPARSVDLRHEHLPDRPAQRALAPTHVLATVTSATSAPCSSTSRCQIRFAVWRCLRGASRSPSSHSSINARYGPSFGAGLPTARFDSGKGDNNAARTARRGPVIHRKLSHGTRSDDGERFAERALSAAATCRQQRRSLFDFLTELLTAHSRGDPPPALA
jgi:hypothetical protein